VSITVIFSKALLTGTEPVRISENTCRRKILRAAPIQSAA
jgi:hypothetical protein